MANESQARAAPERVISVDLSEGDPSKAISRRAARSDIAAHVRDDDDRGNRAAPKRSKTEQELFKRMTRMQRSLTQNFDQKLANQQAEHQRELADLRKQYETGVDVERGGAAELKSAHEKAMAELERQLTEANEKGDSAGIARITTAMIKADGEYHAKASGTQARRDVTGVDPNKGGQQRQQQQQPVAKGPTAAGSRFILANEDWWEDPEFAMEKAAASTIFLDLVKNEGFSDNDDETFKEVAKRLKAKFTNLPVVGVRKRGSRNQERDEGGDTEGDDGPGDGDDDEDGDDEGRDRDRDRERDRGGNGNEGRGRAPAMRVTDRGAGNGRVSQGNRRTLTSEEIATMRKVGLNPESDKDVMSFMKEAVAMENASR